MSKPSKHIARHDITQLLYLHNIPVGIQSVTFLWSSVILQIFMSVTQKLYR